MLALPQGSWLPLIAEILDPPLVTHAFYTNYTQAINDVVNIPKSTVQRSYYEKNRIEILQRTHIFKANWCLKIHNAHLELVSPISG